MLDRFDFFQFPKNFMNKDIQYHTVYTRVREYRLLLDIKNTLGKIYYYLLIFFLITFKTF